jgi:hypothetical protein
VSLSGVIRRKGAAVTFTSTTSTIDPATDLSSSPVTTTVTGHMMQVAGDPDVYEKLNLVESDNPTCEFVPDVVGQMPELGASVVWGGNNFVVKNRNALAMAGTATAAFLVVGK